MVGVAVGGSSLMFSCSEMPTSVAGVVGACVAGEGGGVAPVCGTATVEVAGALSTLEEEESDELGPRVVGEPFGVGGTIGMKVLVPSWLLWGAVI